MNTAQKWTKLYYDENLRKLFPDAFCDVFCRIPENTAQIEDDYRRYFLKPCAVLDIPEGGALCVAETDPLFLYTLSSCAAYYLLGKSKPTEAHTIANIEWNAYLSYEGYPAHIAGFKEFIPKPWSPLFGECPDWWKRRFYIDDLAVLFNLSDTEGLKIPDDATALDEYLHYYNDTTDLYHAGVQVPECDVRACTLDGMRGIAKLPCKDGRPIGHFPSTVGIVVIGSMTDPGVRVFYEQRRHPETHYDVEYWTGSSFLTGTLRVDDPRFPAWQLFSLPYRNHVEAWKALKDKPFLSRNEMACYEYLAKIFT